MEGSGPSLSRGMAVPSAYVSPAGDPKAPCHSRGCTSDSHCKQSFLYAHQQKNHGSANTKVRRDNTSAVRDSAVYGLFCFLLTCIHPKITNILDLTVTLLGNPWNRDTSILGADTVLRLKRKSEVLRLLHKVMGEALQDTELRPSFTTGN